MPRQSSSKRNRNSKKKKRGGRRSSYGRVWKRERVTKELQKVHRPPKRPAHHRQQCWKQRPIRSHFAVLTTTRCLDQEEAPVPGDLAGEGRHLVDEVKEGQRCWSVWPLTSDILDVHTDWLNQADNVTTPTLVLRFFRNSVFPLSSFSLTTPAILSDILLFDSDICAAALFKGNSIDLRHAFKVQMTCGVEIL